MILIAMVAIAFGAEMMRRQSVTYRKKANLYASYEARARDWGKTADRYAAERRKHLLEIQAFAESGGGEFRASWKSLIDPAIRSLTLASMEAEKCHRIAAHWAALRAKYDRATRRPWLAVAPDPSPP
jgi:hypothetical protein